jgi:hypothetical protein
VSRLVVCFRLASLVPGDWSDVRMLDLRRSIVGLKQETKSVTAKPPSLSPRSHPDLRRSIVGLKQETKSVIAKPPVCHRESAASSILSDTCEKYPGGLPELSRDDAALRALVMSWHLLTPDVRSAIMQLVPRTG